MFKFFENILNPFPGEEKYQQKMPDSMWQFIYVSMYGAKKWIFLVAAFSALIGMFDVFLFYTLGNLVEWLVSSSGQNVWQTQRWDILKVVLVVALSVVVVTMQTLFRQQVLAVNFPMRLRWRFHNWLLEQSMSFYQDDFAGRISTKVMQTALSVRTVCFVVEEVFVYVGVTLVSMAVLVGSFSFILMLPFLVWIVVYLLMLIYFVPKISQASDEQAQSRSLMSGRINDAYANIATVKLFSHAGKEAEYAKESMQEFLYTSRRQMRLISKFEITEHIVLMLLILSVFVLSITLYSSQAVQLGAIATTGAIALRIIGFSQWVMWEANIMFENLGNIKDGLTTISTQHIIRDASQAADLVVTRGSIEFNKIHFAHSKHTPLFDDFCLTIQPGEKVGLVGRSGAGKSTLK